MRADSRPGSDDAAYARARLLALDVDGTLTDGRILYSVAGDTLAFDVRDGLAIEWLAAAGVTVAWISGRASNATLERAKKLHVPEIFVGVADKHACLLELQQRRGIERADTLAMGDDLPDLALVPRAAALVAPSDARPEVLAAADWVTQAAGGRGAVRELAERMLRARGAWPALLARYAAGTRP
ncbi:MAG: phenylphosphate carboxylase subunit delta [Planctomycetota bacterium]|nr:MAG: phenylphosphate carboxylase subunit delta [Planctomycetota bacterium]